MRKLINRLLSVETYIIFLAITGAYCIHVDKLPMAYLHLVIIIVLLNKKNAVDYAEDVPSLEPTPEEHEIFEAEQAVSMDTISLNVAKQRHKRNKYFTKDESKDRHDG